MTSSKLMPPGFEPMLASPLKDGALPKFPCLASPKLDGVRVHVFEDVMSRKLKKIPNAHVQKLLARPEFAMLDGEIVVGPPTAPDVYLKTMSGVMSRDGEPDIKLLVFDVIPNMRENGLVPGAAFSVRYALLKNIMARDKTGLLELVEQVVVNNEEELTALEEKWLAQGYEGVMIRSLLGMYKFGRSTVKEGHLLKLKRFLDSEAEVLECIELEHNNNVATKNELGRTKRSSHKAGKSAGFTLGALRVKDVKTGVEFQIGSGFTEQDRNELWAIRQELPGSFIKYSYFPTGNKEKPRFPVYLGRRSEIDM